VRSKQLPEEQNASPGYLDGFYISCKAEILKDDNIFEEASHFNKFVTFFFFVFVMGNLTFVTMLLILGDEPVGYIKPRRLQTNTHSLPTQSFLLLLPV
jgi:hypothetical protein